MAKNKDTDKVIAVNFEPERITPENVIGMVDKMLDDVEGIIITYLLKDNSLGIIASSLPPITVIGMLEMGKDMVLRESDALYEPEYGE